MYVVRSLFSRGIVSVGETVDPSLLPVASGQAIDGGSTYGRSLSDNQTYVDPTTGVTVLKLTDNGTPNAGNHYHGYSEGGPTISLPWVGGDGKTYYTAFIADGWLVDIRYDTLATSNWRTIPIDGEINVAFSLNPATPRICYYIDDGDNQTVHRYTTATNADADTGFFPWTPPGIGADSFGWLQVNLNDAWILGMATGGTNIGEVCAMRLSDGFERNIGVAGHDVDEPHIDREFPFVYISTNDVANRVVNLETGADVTESGPDVDAADHESPMRGFVAVYHLDHGMVKVTKEGVRSVPVDVIVKPPSAEAHQSGCWVYDNPDNYVVIDNVDETDGAYPINEHMIGMVSMDTEDVRLICCGDNSGIGYDTGGQMHPQISPDGKLLMWTSNMNNSGSHQIFVAKLPTS